MKLVPVFVRFPLWRWWFVFWPPGLRRYFADAEKFRALRISVDHRADISVLTLVETRTGADGLPR